MTGRPRPSDDDLVGEQATNQQYLRELDAKGKRMPEISITAGSKWLDDVRLPLARAPYGPLIGRVGLDPAAIDDHPASFYIGPRHLEVGDVPVYSWAAPVAKVFYETCTCTHEYADVAVVVRTLTSKVDHVVAIHDDWARDFHGVSPLATSRAPDVATPVVRTRRRAAPRSVAPSDPDADDPTEASEAPSDRMPVVIEPTVLSDGDMRTEDAVRRAIAAPRTGTMPPVLATLQADQYDVVARRGDTSLIVQGHPGTGKTVVAVHRAAYLVNPDNRITRPRRLLLLGPTAAWVQHVRPVLAQLLEQGGVDGDVKVRDAAGWLAEIADLREVPVGTPDGLDDDIEARLATLAGESARILARRNRWNPREGTRRIKVRAIYEEMRVIAQQDPDLAGNTRLLACLRPWDNAAHERRLLPVLAQCAIELMSGTRGLGEFDHIIVDEAQDLTRIEWTIADRLNSGGDWTLVGDMNQRRTDRTHFTWSALAADIGLESVTPTVLDRGFRSTQQILDFAGHVLPRAERGSRSMQVGPEVRFARATSADRLVEVAMAEADRLIVAHPGGTVAIYTEQASNFIPALTSAGWRKVTSEATIQWQRTDRRLSLHTPTSGRGIEFDGVVVVEPSDFEQNLGRSGPLYTTLTRANRELAVVHYRALPHPLARARRASR